MTEEQLKNIVYFSILFSTGDLYNFSPDYIEEKWNKYIGVKPEITNTEITKPSEYLKLLVVGWIDIWLKDDDKNNAEVIINLIVELREYILCGVGITRLIKIVDIFKKYINIEEVNLEFYNCLHANLNSSIESLLNVKENKRDKNLILLLS